MMSGRRRAVCAVLSGAILALGAPPLRLWPAVFVSMALFGIAIDGTRARRAAWLGWLSGASATLGAFYWIVGTVTRFTGLPLIAALIVFVLLAAVAGIALGAAAFVARIAEPVLGHPMSLACGLLVAERWAPSVFPWQFAAPLIYAPAAPQAADLVGISGVGAIVLTSMSAMVSPWTLRASTAPRRARVYAAIGAVAIVALFTYGAVRERAFATTSAHDRVFRVGLVQPAIPATVRWETEHHAEILANLQRLTNVALSRGAEVVVWSEGAYPWPLPHAAGLDGERGPPVMPLLGTEPIVFGAMTIDDAGNRYNSTLIRDGAGRISAPVDKRVLVPFGEYIPWVSSIPGIRRIFARVQGLTPGARPTVLTLPVGVRLGVLNCFEDTLPHVAVDVADAHLLVNLTNDAWFGEGSAPWQHLMLAQWRSIELRRDLVRAVNMGVTVHVDSRGRILEHVPLGEPHALVFDATPRQSWTPARIAIPWLPRVALVTVAGIALLGAKRRRALTRPRPAS